MPRSGFQANNHARVAAHAVMARLTGQPVNAAPIIANTCYSFVSANGGHVGSVHKWNVAQKTLVPADGAGCLSAARRVHQADWAGADLPVWSQRIAHTLQGTGPGPWLGVAPCFGSLARVHHLARCPGLPMQAAQLLAPANPYCFDAGHINVASGHRMLPFAQRWALAGLRRLAQQQRASAPAAYASLN